MTIYIWVVAMFYQQATFNSYLCFLLSIIFILFMAFYFVAAIIIGVMCAF